MLDCHRDNSLHVIRIFCYHSLYRGLDEPIDIILKMMKLSRNHQKNISSKKKFCERKEKKTLIAAT